MLMAIDPATSPLVMTMGTATANTFDQMAVVDSIAPLADFGGSRRIASLSVRLTRELAGVRVSITSASSLGSIARIAWLAGPTPSGIGHNLASQAIGR